MPCTTILVGKNATNDGSTIISRNDDGGFCAKQIRVIMPNKQPRKYKTVISHLTVELPDNPVKYTSVPSVVKDNGIWPACGINDYNVGMTATETITSNPRVLGADPLVVYQPAKGGKKAVPGGIGEEDLVTLVLPYVKTAREGVKRLGALLEQYGTYEMNGIAFNDQNEVWWLESIGGHHWIAKRVPDDRVVIMPNQFGLDNFDFNDAEGEQKDNMCSDDLRDFVIKNSLYTGSDFEHFNPRLAFGSRKDSDHNYNTPRAWFLARYFLERSYKWDGELADYTPESNDIPWSFVPEKKVTVEDVRYLLGSYYQGTQYNPYDAKAAKRGLYRVIGVPNTDVCGIIQIRNNVPDVIKGVEWLSMGGSGFTACFPIYSNVESMPAYLQDTKATVSTETMYWQSRLIAALTDAHYNTAILFDERYQDAVLNKGRELLCKYDALYIESNDVKVLSEANAKIAEMVKSESDKVLGTVLRNASEHMKTRYHRGDN